MAETRTQAGPNGLHEDSQSELSSQAQKAQDKAQQVAGQAQDKARQAKDQAQDRVRSVVDERSTQAGEQVSRQASDLRSVAESLREQGKDQPARMAEQAADRAERLGSYLSRSNADRILSDIEDFGRRQPWAIAVGGLVVGFAASRFLKASSQKRYESRGWGGELGSSRTQIPPSTGEIGAAGGFAPAQDPSTPPTAQPAGTPPPSTSPTGTL